MLELAGRSVAQIHTATLVQLVLPQLGGSCPADLAGPSQAPSSQRSEKLMLARWLHTDHPVLLADEPTRGVDVGAKADILVTLETIVAQNRSLIVVSSELEEVVGLSDRVLVLSKGRSIGLLDSADQEISVATILHLIFDSVTAPAQSSVGAHA